jgi:hypothetical protein
VVMRVVRSAAAGARDCDAHHGRVEALLTTVVRQGGDRKVVDPTPLLGRCRAFRVGFVGDHPSLRQPVRFANTQQWGLIMSASVKTRSRRIRSIKPLNERSNVTEAFEEGTHTWVLVP